MSFTLFLRSSSLSLSSSCFAHLVEKNRSKTESKKMTEGTCKLNGNSASACFVEIQLAQQRYDGGHPFPCVLGPGPALGSNLSRLQEAIKQHKAWVEEQLLSSGAVLLRGFGIETAEEFDQVVEAFGYEELSYVGGSGSRSRVVGRVYTANEAPPPLKIPFHHEMSHVPVPPSKLFFFCEEEPKSGGETPIVLSHLIYQRMKERFAEFVQRLEEHGVVYTTVLAEDYDPSSPIGRGWKLTFSTDDKRIAEERAAQLGLKLEWMDDEVKVVIGPMPAIRIHEARGQKTWFNAIAFHYDSSKDSPNDPRKLFTAFGDGVLLPPDVGHDCIKILDEECVIIPWQKGDVLLLDNLAVLHSRQPFHPPRRILVSLCK